MRETVLLDLVVDDGRSTYAAKGATYERTRGEECITNRELVLSIV